jgi:hypothetical protein
VSYDSAAVLLLTLPGYALTFVGCYSAYVRQRNARVCSRTCSIRLSRTPNVHAVMYCSCSASPPELSDKCHESNTIVARQFVLLPTVHLTAVRAHTYTGRCCLPIAHRPFYPVLATRRCWNHTAAMRTRTHCRRSPTEHSGHNRLRSARHSAAHTCNKIELKSADTLVFAYSSAIEPRSTDSANRYTSTSSGSRASPNDVTVMLCVAPSVGNALASNGAARRVIVACAKSDQPRIRAHTRTDCCTAPGRLAPTMSNVPDTAPALATSVPVGGCAWTLSNADAAT